MKPSFKNVMMIGMALVLVGTSAITISYANRDTAMPARPAFSSGQFEQNGASQENPLENFGSQNDSSQSSQNSQQPQNGAPGQPPQQNGQNGSNTPPSFPDQSQSGDSSNGEQSAPAAPDQSQSSDGSQSEGNAQSGRNTAADETPNVTDTARSDFGNMPARRGGTQVISVLCYLFAALQIGIIAAIAVYLALSKLNKLSFNQTMGRFKK